ncbi:MAG: hypothetical protein H6545_01635 [Bacteroidales bacterium]|nr:hypothetical protein [Bacteroidales bacterium]
MSAFPILRSRRQHVESAFRAVGLHWPGERVIINMAPADITREGSSL